MFTIKNIFQFGMAFKELYEFMDEEDERRQRLTAAKAEKTNLANEKAANNHVTEDDAIVEENNENEMHVLKDIDSGAKVDNV